MLILSWFYFSLTVKEKYGEKKNNMNKFGYHGLEQDFIEFDNKMEKNVCICCVDNGMCGYLGFKKIANLFRYTEATLNLATMPAQTPVWSFGFRLTLKAPKKKNCIWKCRLFMLSAEYSCRLFKPIFEYRQTVWTLIRLLLKEQSDLGLHCLQKWLLKSQTDDKADDNSCDWRFKG